MEKFKLIPFDLQRAKTPSNPDGLEVVTKGDSESVTIAATDFRSSRRHPNGDSLYPILAITHSKFGDRTAFYTCSGLIADDDECDYPGDTLYLKEPIKPRRMTNKELSWWLRDCPEEHRELKYGIDGPNVYADYNYPETNQNSSCHADIVVRRNGGEWFEPLIEEE